MLRKFENMTRFVSIIAFTSCVFMTLTTNSFAQDDGGLDSLVDDTLTVTWNKSGKVVVFGNVTKTIADSGSIVSGRGKSKVTWIKK